MMRIKEAVQRRRLIQEMNDEWNAHEEENAEAPSFIGRTLPIAPCEDDAESTNSARNELALQQFTHSLNVKMSPLQVFEKMVEQCSDVMPIFYRSAFLSCVEDKKRNGQVHPGRTIATIRDHAHLLVDFIEDILCMMFETPLQHTPLDPYSIGIIYMHLRAHGSLKIL
uniref:Uncharacterized protein n=1 Tax=Parascaris univalens TaxID=6257 RepID=A0A915B5P4_PARUN